VAIQAQIQALLAGEAVAREEGGGTEESNTGSYIEIASYQFLAEKVGRFITACRLYLRMRIRGITMEEWI